MIRFLPTLLLVALLSATADARPATTQPDATWTGIALRSDGGGELIYFFGTRVIDGHIAICGTGFTRNSHASHRRFVPGIIADLRVRLGTVQLLQQPDNMPVYDSEAEMRKAPAGCTLTRVAADPALLRQPLTIEPRKGYATDW